MVRTTDILIKNLYHNRRLLDEINRCSIAKCYDIGIVFAACEAIETELRRRGVF